MKIKPCSKCKSEKVVSYFYDEGGVQCQNCELLLKGFASEQEAIEAWNQRADDWISIEEKLPDKNIKVLFYNANSKNMFTSFYISAVIVTHWRLLPDPPEISK